MYWDKYDETKYSRYKRAQDYYTHNNINDFLNPDKLPIIKNEIVNQKIKFSTDTLSWENIKYGDDYYPNKKLKYQEYAIYTSTILPLPSSFHNYIFNVPFRNYFYGEISDISTDELKSIYLKSDHKDLSYQINNYMNSGYVVLSSSDSTSYLEVSHKDGSTSYKSYISNKYRPSSGMIDISFEAFKPENGDIDLTFNYYC